MATQNFKRNLLLNLYREGEKKNIRLVSFLLPFKREIKDVWHLQPISSVWRPLAFLPVTLSLVLKRKGNYTNRSQLNKCLWYHQNEVAGSKSSRCIAVQPFPLTSLCLKTHLNQLLTWKSLGQDLLPRKLTHNIKSKHPSLEAPVPPVPLYSCATGQAASSAPLSPLKPKQWGSWVAWIRRLNKFPLPLWIWNADHISGQVAFGKEALSLLNFLLKFPYWKEKGFLEWKSGRAGPRQLSLVLIKCKLL